MTWQLTLCWAYSRGVEALLTSRQHHDGTGNVRDVRQQPRDAADEELSDRSGRDPLGRCYSGLLGTKLVAGLEVHVSWHSNRAPTIPKYCGMLVEAIRALVKRESLVDAAGLLIRYFNNGAPPGMTQEMAGFRAGEGRGCARPG